MTPVWCWCSKLWPLHIWEGFLELEDTKHSHCKTMTCLKSIRKFQLMKGFIPQNKCITTTSSLVDIVTSMLNVE